MMQSSGGENEMNTCRFDWMAGLVFLFGMAWATHCGANEALLVLSYHDIRDDVAAEGDPDAYAVSHQNFAAHLDWLSGHGYNPVSLSQVIEASRSGRPLPKKPVLLTFDDGLRSTYTHAYPLLRAYGYPALIAVVSGWMDLPDGTQIDYAARPFTRDEFLTWEQLREMSNSGLVEVASHTHDLHRGVRSNPQGNTTPAATTRIYDPAAGSHEDEATYRARIRSDLAQSVALIRKHTGHAPRAVVWPYAAYNDAANQIADSLGMNISFDLEGRSTPVTPDLHGLARLLVTGNPGSNQLAYELRHPEDDAPLRALQVDLDSVYDTDPAQQERNLDLLVERVKRIAPSHVFLQAFADPDGNGSADALYFPNRYMPMRADLFGRAAWQLKTRAGVGVYAWLPVLGYELPDNRMREALSIRSPEANGIYRLDFSRPEVHAVVTGIYEDLAVNSWFGGLLFHDDAYLRDTELTGLTDTLDDSARTRALIAFTLDLRDAAQRWRPKLKTARNLYARPLLDPSSESWFAQRLDLFNNSYDYTALMAMPWMEGSHDPEAWLGTLVQAARAHDPALSQTLFELQTLDWNTRVPISGDKLQSQLRQLQSLGVRHLAWYPDDFIANRPQLQDARAAMSAGGFPYEPK